MRKARSINDLYGLLKDFDMAMTNQAPLATALNRIADRPMVGRFSVTPRQLAKRMALSVIGEEAWSDARIITQIAESTGLELRYVHGEVENLREVRRHTAQVERHLEGRDSELVWKNLSRLPTVERAMERFPLDFFEGIDVGVVALDLFDELDKHVLPPPDSLTEVSPWEEGSFTIPSIADMGNERLIGRHVADLIDKTNMNATAIVMDTDGSMADSIRTSLYAKGLPFQTARSMRDLPGIRDMLRFLELCLGLSTARMGDIKRLVRSVDLKDIDPATIAFNIRNDGRLFTIHATESKDSALMSLKGRMESISTMNLSQASTSLLKDDELTMTMRLLRELGLAKAPLRADTLEDLRYGVDQLSEEILRDDDEKEGVVLVDCRSSAYVDRPIVFHLGLGNEWSRRIQRRKHIDSEAELEKDQSRFEVLLQQGEQRLYMTSRVAKGRKVLPCVYFNRALDRPVRDFDDLTGEGGFANGCWLPDPVSLEFASKTAEEPKMPVAHSPSALNQFLKCPRKYHFSRLCESPDSGPAFRGTLVHRYAELLAHHPSYASEEGMDRCLEILQSDYVSLSHKGRDRFERTALRGLMRNAAEFASRYTIEEMPEKSGRGNPLFSALGEEPRIGNTEIFLEDRSILLRGLVDLMVNDSLAVDHKSGAPVNTSARAKNITSIWGEGDPDTQPLAYMALLRSLGERRREISLHYNHLKPVPADKEGYDPSRHVIKVTYTGTGRADILKGDDPWIIRLLRQGPKDFAPFLEEVGEKDFCDHLVSIRAWELPPEGDMEALEGFMQFLKGRSRKRAVGKKVFTRALEKMREEVPYTKDTVLITTETMERFLEKTMECHNQIRDCKRDGFPALPRKEGYCSKCEFLDICTEALE